MSEPPRRRRGRPSAQEAAPSEAEVLAQGLQAFSELGYEGASMRVLAHRLHVSHSFIVGRYGTKDEFWRAVIQYARNQFMAPVIPLLNDNDLDDLDRFIAITRSVLQQSARTPALMRILDEETRHNSARLDYLTDILITPLDTAVSPLARRLIEQGHTRPIASDVVEFTILAMARTITAEPLLHRLGTSYADDPTAFIDTLTNILLAGILTKHDA